MTQEFPFQPYDRLKQFGYREIPVEEDKVFMKNGSVGAAWTEVTFDETAQLIVILNTHASQSLRFSLESDGASYITIFSHDALKVGSKLGTIYMYGEGAATTYDIIGFYLD